MAQRTRGATAAGDSAPPRSIEIPEHHLDEMGMLISRSHAAIRGLAHLAACAGPRNVVRCYDLYALLRPIQSQIYGAYDVLVPYVFDRGRPADLDPEPPPPPAGWEG